MPVWRTVPKLVPFRLAGITPPEIIKRETARAAAGLHTLPAHRPLTQRLRTPILNSSSRHNLASSESLQPPQVQHGLPVSLPPGSPDFLQNERQVS
ncbi:hypothetical protein SMACR_05104 [Sordaria macrospora]|uniref:WGS project CABT00000000 data, contig 2.22 n=2 Tax=Sordaria macrospora TaxID=5147 RepID=F7W2P1_SORMK